MIHQTNATMIRFTCDACGQSTREFVIHGPDGNVYRPDYPEGWKTWPEFVHMREDPTLLLCPDHADLITTARLVQKMLVATEARVDG